jgi:hypothetical protein
MARLVENQRRTNRLLAFLASVTAAAVVGAAVLQVAGGWHGI